MTAVYDFLTQKVAPRWGAVEAKCLEIEVDTEATPIEAGGIAVLAKFDRNVMIEKVQMVVKTAEGGTLTVDVGDYSDEGVTAIVADGFLDGVNGNATAKTITSSLESGGSTNTYAKGCLLAGTSAAPKYICALFNNAADKAVLLFRVLYTYADGML